MIIFIRLDLLKLTLLIKVRAKYYNLCAKLASICCDRKRRTK